MITEPRWKSYIVETTQPIFTPEQCQDIINAGRAEPRQEASVGNKQGIRGGIVNTKTRRNIKNITLTFLSIIVWLYIVEL